MNSCGCGAAPEPQPALLDEVWNHSQGWEMQFLHKNAQISLQEPERRLCLHSHCPSSLWGRGNCRNLWGGKWPEPGFYWELLAAVQAGFWAISFCFFFPFSYEIGACIIHQGPHYLGASNFWFFCSAHTFLTRTQFDVQSQHWHLVTVLLPYPCSSHLWPK